MKSILLITAGAIAATAACVPTSPLQQPRAGFAADSGGFITTLGVDTTAVERFVIRGNTLEAQVVGRTPRTYHLDVRLAWDDQGRVTSYEARQRNAGDPADSPRSTVAYAVAPDSITITRRTASGVQTRKVANRGISTVLALPAYSPMVVLARDALARGDTLVMAQFANDALPFTVRRDAATTHSFVAPGLGTIVVETDAHGRVQSVDSRRSTLGSVATRVSDMDVEGWARTYAARDAAGTGLGPLSPPDTVHASVAGATILIPYQRPSVRGRQIFGGPVVPFGKVWRTGANSATGFVTDRDLTVGGVRVPAGSYTLWTIPNRDSWELIVNKQTGQWGTVYNEAQDLARIPMTVERLASPREQFTIDVADGRLSLEWENTRAWVPIAIAP